MCYLYQLIERHAASGAISQTAVKLLRTQVPSWRQHGTAAGVQHTKQVVHEGLSGIGDWQEGGAAPQQMPEMGMAGMLPETEVH